MIITHIGPELLPVRAVGHLWFYSKAVCDIEGAGGLCLQRDPSAGPISDFVEKEFPDPAQLKDKTLVVHCLVTGSSLQKRIPTSAKAIRSPDHIS